MVYAHHITEYKSCHREVDVVQLFIYPLYTIRADLPQTNRTYTASYADNAVIISTHQNINAAIKIFSDIDISLRKLWEMTLISLGKDLCSEVYLSESTISSTS